MTIRKLNELIKIAKEYKMYPLVKYYEMKIDFIGTPYNVFLEKSKRKKRGYFTCYLSHKKMVNKSKTKKSYREL